MVCAACGIVGADARPNWKERAPRETGVKRPALGAQPERLHHHADVGFDLVMLAKLPHTGGGVARTTTWLGTIFQSNRCALHAD
jgi:hypothetical protein